MLTPDDAVYSNATFAVHLIVESVRVPCDQNGCGSVAFSAGGRPLFDFALQDNRWFYRGTGTAARPYAGVCGPSALPPALVPTLSTDAASVGVRNRAPGQGQCVVHRLGREGDGDGQCECLMKASRPPPPPKLSFAQHLRQN